LSRQSNYESETNNEIYLSTLQNKFKKITIAIIEIISIFIKDATKTTLISIRNKIVLYIWNILDNKILIESLIENFFKFVNNIDLNIKKSVVT